MTTKYTPLAAWLADRDDDAVTLSLGDVERIVGFALPESARRYAAFWAGSTVDAELNRAGWHAYPRLSAGAVVFRKIVGPAPEKHAPAPAEAAQDDAPDLVLIGCVKSKLPGRHRARDLYTSPLFLGRVAYAESTGAIWYVLSAKYGLVAPDDLIDDYDLSLADASASERADWATRVLEAFDERIGSVAAKTIEIHAGDQYRDRVLLLGLRSRGAKVNVPLEGMRFGGQLAWYAGARSVATEGLAKPTPAAAAGSPAIRIVDGLARKITEDFANGAFDLSDRAGAPTPRWESMPEMVAVRALNGLGASPREIRMFITFLAAMDRARDADLLWRNGLALFRVARWAFEPARCCERSFSDLRDALAITGVSQRHGPDSAAWRLIAEALTDDASPPAVRRAIDSGAGDAKELLEAVRAPRATGQPWFPFLSGPKISEMWVRILAVPGTTHITGLDILNVAVDVQVRKVTEYLGVTDTGGRQIENVRSVIQEAWKAAAREVVGPAAISGTAAGLDPALWFMGKWGCTYCERAKRRMPIGRACEHCRFPSTS